MQKSKHVWNAYSEMFEGKMLYGETTVGFDTYVGSVRDHTRAAGGAAEKA
jgi:hypothetical protein